MEQSRLGFSRKKTKVLRRSSRGLDYLQELQRRVGKARPLKELARSPEGLEYMKGLLDCEKSLNKLRLSLTIEDIKEDKFSSQRCNRIIKRQKDKFNHMEMQVQLKDYLHWRKDNQHHQQAMNQQALRSFSNKTNSMQKVFMDQYMHSLHRENFPSPPRKACLEKVDTRIVRTPAKKAPPVAPARLPENPFEYPSQKKARPSQDSNKSMLSRVVQRQLNPSRSESKQRLFDPSRYIAQQEQVFGRLERLDRPRDKSTSFLFTNNAHQKVSLLDHSRLSYSIVMLEDRL